MGAKKARLGSKRTSHAVHGSDYTRHFKRALVRLLAGGLGAQQQG